MCTYFKFAFRVWANTHICSYIHHGISASVSPLLDIHFHFQAFAVMDKALYRLSWTNLFLDMCFISLKYLLVKTIGSMVNICLALETMLGHFRKWLHHFTFLQAIDGSSNRSTSLPIHMWCWTCSSVSSNLCPLFYGSVFLLHFDSFYKVYFKDNLLSHHLRGLQNCNCVVIRHVHLLCCLF